jgi:two-component system cell cycle sensor histidine kinase/response regulator CckA
MENTRTTPGEITGVSGPDADAPAPSDATSLRFEPARLKLARLHARGVPLRELWESLAQIVTEALDIDRIGVWVVIDEGRAIRCRYLYQRSNREMFQGAVLRAQDFPAYFEALESRRTIAASHVLESELARELRQAYFEPLGITSLLDAPIYLDGRVVGVVCHEHTGTPRQWSGAECDFVSSVADTIARLYQEHERSNAQSALRMYEAHLMELHRMEAVGRIAAGVAHDFRGILSAANGFAELIRRVPDLPPDADRYALRIIDAMQRGQQLTQEIVNFGKDMPAMPRVIDASRTVESMRNMFNVLLGNRVTLFVDAKHPVSRVFIDPSQLERMLLNLVLNARDAMPSGGMLTITVRDVTVEEGDETAQYVEIAVIDTGTGMDEEVRKNIFKPFFTTKGEQGTGLGLAIVDQIVTRAGGFVRIQSEVGRGTTVRIFLPRIAGAASSAAA